MILHHLFHVAKIQTIPWQYKGFSLIGKGNSLKAPAPILRAPSSIKNRKNYDFLYYIPNFAKFTLQNTANISIFLHFFCKILARIQKRIYFCSALQQ